MTVDEIPPVAISWGRTTVFKTGSWRNVTPHYVRRLPPCRAGCPVGNDVEGWLEAVGNRDWVEAVRLLIDEQPLPSVCGRVCYHPCETACNRGQFDGAVSIRAVERFLGDRAARLGVLPASRTGKGSSSGRILVVGSGPSGLAAAWTLARLGHRVEVMERAQLPGGLLRYGIPAYRLPRDVLDRELARLSRIGVTFRRGTALLVDGCLADLRHDYDAVYLAPGAAGHRSSGISGAPDGMVVGAIEFLKNVSDGTPPLPSPSLEGGDVSLSNSLINKKIVVIGGGNSAIDAARSALRLGADVTILYRRTRAEMPAYEDEVEAALVEGVNVDFLVSPVRIVENAPPLGSPPVERGGMGKFNLQCIRNRLGRPDDSGRRRPEPVSGSEFTVQVDYVVDAVGEYPDPAQLTPDGDEQSALAAVDIWGRTGIDGIWVGGDFSGADRTVAHAIGAGKRSAVAIDMVLNGRFDPSADGLLLGFDRSITVGRYLEGDLTAGYDNPEPVEVSDLNLAYHSHSPRTRLNEASPERRTGDFAEIAQDWRVRSVIREASRCFHCGTCDSCGNCHIFCPDGAVVRDPVTMELSINLDYCKGCGVCASECPRAAIEMWK